jgi:hypothetical protein
MRCASFVFVPFASGKRYLCKTRKIMIDPGGGSAHSKGVFDTRANMTEMSQAARVIATFGGRANMERDTKISYARIRRWDDNGFIPSEDHQLILDLAYDLGKDLSLTDLFAHLDDPAERAKQSTATEA